ncbi:IS66 family transposase [Dethiothermospora halolimnae]|uniref:IS66 family transposase n=1 Tax=Dethiothermospora halolimnae TaxID=3114390 RepID=UPI003CCB8859
MTAKLNWYEEQFRLSQQKHFGKYPTSKSYMRLYCTGTFEPQIFLYEYQPSRAKKHPKNFLKDFKGFLQIDGYPGYNAVEDVTLVGCFAHARRGFTDALKARPKEAVVSKTTAGEGVNFCNELFKIGKTLKDLSYDKRYERCLKQSKSALEHGKKGKS